MGLLTAGQIKPAANIKTSERRRLYAQIAQQYGVPELSKELEEKVLPSGIKLAKFVSFRGAKGKLYLDSEQVPVWFAAEEGSNSGKEVLYPTCYTCWKAPFLVPTVATHPHIVDVLRDGANLMRPGTVPPFDARLRKGTVVGVVDTGSPQVVKAVGVLNEDLAGVERTIGSTGVAVTVLHVVGDCLSALKEVPVPAIVSPQTVSPQTVSPQGDTLSSQDDTVSSQGGIGDTAGEKPTPTGVEGLQDDPAGEDPAVEHLGEGPAVEDLAEAVQQLTVQDIDNFFTRALYQTLTQEKLALPISSSNFMTLINNNLPTQHSQVVMKKTSWKKSAKFLKHFEKNNFLKLKGKDDDLIIVSVSDVNNNDTLKNFVPYKVKSKKKSGSESGAQDKKSSELVLCKYYKPTSSIMKVFEIRDKLLTAAEIKQLLNQYIDQHQLVSPANKKLILLDDDLKSVLKAPDNSIGRDKIFDQLLSKFTEYHQLFRGEGGEPLSKQPIRGQLEPIEIVSETKIGRKVVTRVFKFEKYGLSSDKLSDILKVKCSGSTTISANLQNPKYVDVTVQGPHFKTINSLLTTEYGVNAKWIRFTDKTRSKKKKAA